MENLKTDENKKDIFELLPVLEKLDPQQREMFKIYTSENFLLLNEEQTSEFTKIASEKLGSERIMEVLSAVSQYEDARQVQERKILVDFADIIRDNFEKGSDSENKEGTQDTEGISDAKEYETVDVEASVSEDRIIESGKEVNMKVAKRSKFLVKNGSKLNIKVAVGCNFDVEEGGIVNIETGKSNNINKL
ncbi:MAG: hypothetical protein ACOCUH_00745 [Bacteriovoracia bacterium]